jgi:hypothetical protein
MKSPSRQLRTGDATQTTNQHMTFHNIARAIAGAFAVFWLGAALFFAWAVL